MPNVELLPDKVNNKNLQEALREQELKETDLTRKKLFRVVSEALDAEDILLDDNNKEVGRTPNHEIRLKAAKEAREILGETKRDESSAQRIPNIVIVLPTGKVMNGRN